MASPLRGQKSAKGTPVGTPGSYGAALTPCCAPCKVASGTGTCASQPQLPLYSGLGHSSVPCPRREGKAAVQRLSPRRLFLLWAWLGKVALGTTQWHTCQVLTVLTLPPDEEEDSHGWGVGLGGRLWRGDLPFPDPEAVMKIWAQQKAWLGAGLGSRRPLPSSPGLWLN